MSNSLRVSSRSAPSTVTMRIAGFSRTPWCSSHPDASPAARCSRLASRHGDVVPRAAQHGVDARAQLARPERLGDVVVGAGLEALQGVDLLGARAEHHDVRRADGADALRGLEAVHAGHVDVERRDERLMLADELEAFLAVRRAVDDEARLRQDRRQEGPDVFLVLDHDCDARCFHRCTFRRRRVESRLLDVGQDIPEGGLEGAPVPGIQVPMPGAARDAGVARARPVGGGRGSPETSAARHAGARVHAARAGLVPAAHSRMPGTR